jgi:hypothetical protein
MSDDDDLPDEDWSPDDDKLQKEYMKKSLLFMERMNVALDEQKEAEEKRKMHRPPSAIRPPELSAYVMPDLSVKCRMISNGWIVSYVSVKGYTEEYSALETLGTVVPKAAVELKKYVESLGSDSSAVGA